MSDISLFEAMRTQRSIRRYASDPVPDELIATIIEAATHAPSATNRQPWHFLVIRDGELKRRMSERYVDAWSSIYPNVDPSTLPQSSRSGLELGTVLTTIHRKHEQEIKELLRIPASVETVALIPLGYPAEGKRFGGGKREPVDEVTSYDRSGQRAP